MTAPRLLFVTGRLAEQPLRRIVAELAATAGYIAEVQVLGISVAALMHVDFVKRKLDWTKEKFDRVILPGWCQGDLTELERQFGVPFERGPKELFDLPEHFGRSGRRQPDLSRYDIQILAEINHAPRLDERELLHQAQRLKTDGADLIDLGCIPGESWSGVAAATRRLRDEGLRVSIDSFDRTEVESAVDAGAELVLSVNGTNRDWASRLPAELVAIPDDVHDLNGLDATIEVLERNGARFRIDPILEPIGFGFAASLGRYLEARRRWPNAEIMMGIGNLTELTEVDSAGINLVLAGFCQELGIRSILTTQVINWCRTAVREFDLARRMVHWAFENRSLPKNLGTGLEMLRDRRLRERTPAELEELAAGIKDPNFRIFAEQGELHVMNRDGYCHGTNPFALFKQLGEIDSSHAFYLGYEMAKGVTALTLGKNYRQDAPLDWGLLTQPEASSGRHSNSENQNSADDSSG